MDWNIITPIHGSEYWVEQMKQKLKLMAKISKALMDSGAMILMMSKGYCDEHGYEILPLDQWVPIEGSGEADVPYLGYVEVRMQILGISSFDQGVLMLISHSTTLYIEGY